MVTATRDRRHEPGVGLDVEEWGQRSAFGASRGWPWWGAVVLALGLSIVGAFIDMKMSGGLGKVFEGAYFVGCVGAVCLVRRRNLFGPMVQAPLILAVTVPIVVLLTKGLGTSAGTMSKLLNLGLPLVTGFPTMAITTGATVVIGGIRFLVQRKPAGDDPDDDRRRPSTRDADRAAARRPRPTDRADRDRAAAREDRGSAPRDRARTPPPARSRTAAADRGGRPSAGRSGQDRAQSRAQPDRDRPDRDRGRSSDRGQSRARPNRDDGRRLPPRRRGDDRFDD